MASDEEIFEQQLNEDRARQAAVAANDRQRQAAKKKEAAVFPWLMLCVAIIFDLLGFIPILNIFTDILAGLILWLWKHSYNSKTNPLIDIVAAKIVDLLCLGVLPSSTFTVVYSYVKKKAASKTGSLAVAKLAI